MKGEQKLFDGVKIDRILIRGVNWLGDAVMTTPAIGAIRRRFPAARIALLATPLVAELFSPHDAVDEVIVYDRKGRHGGIRGRISLAKELRGRRFDLAILLQNAFDAALIARLAAIPLRIGYRTDGRRFLLTHGCPLSAETRRLHHVDYYLNMLSHFGIEADAKALSLKVTADEEMGAAKALKGAGIKDGDPLLGINPGATYGSAKRWYPERFAQAADELARRWDTKIVITGGPEEEGIAEEISAAMESKCLNLAGRTSVRQLMAVIKRCDFFITNDSGPMHIAAALGVPLVAIFGPTDHSTTSPFSEQAVIVRQETDCAPCLLRECPTDHRCMTGITAEEVVNAAAGLRRRSEESARK